MTDIEGVSHEIQAAMFEASYKVDVAKQIKFHDENPAKTMREVSEAIEQLLEAQEFLAAACRLKKQINEGTV